MSVTIPNARDFQLIDGVLMAEVPPAWRPAVLQVIARQKAHHAGFGKLVVDIPFKPRTFGPRKQKPDDPGYQSNHLHGHLQQLAIHFGYTMGEMKEIMKDDVPEWTVEPRRIGKRVKLRPVSEADVSTAVEARAIEWTHLIAAEEGLVLREGKEAVSERR
jgi:hypothetical protein